MASCFQTYRVYCFDALHMVLTSDFIEAASDEEAIAAGEEAGYGSRCEIWQGRQLVAELGIAKLA